MSRRTTLAVLAAAAAVLVVAASLWFEPWRLFTERTVNEAIPQVEATGLDEDTSAGGGGAGDDAAGGESGGDGAGDGGAADPTAEPVVLLSGELISHEHDTSGSVQILELADGSRILRLEDLETSDGPDVHVWLSDAPVLEGTDGWRVFDDGDYHDLGEIEGNRGNQNYELPADLELGRFTSVSLWCDRFDVSFGAAELDTV